MKLSIRDLLLVTAIVAVCAAWWLDRNRLAAKVDAMEKQAARTRQPTPEDFIRALRSRGGNADSIDTPVVQHIDEVQILDNFGPPPISSAPAPNPPKK